MGDNIKFLVSRRLKDARIEAGLSQGQAAKFAKMHRPTLCEIEAGRRNVTVDEIHLFSKLYGVSIGWIMNEGFDKVSDDVQIAAREMKHLKKEDFDKVMSLLKTLQER